MRRDSPALADIALEQGVRDERVIQAIREVPRRQFVPAGHADQAEYDFPVPIGHDQVTSQPSLVAAMIEAVSPQPDEVVLEVGTGYGYQTALLARLARFVWSVERWPDLADAARGNLARAGTVNAEVITGDGSQGLVGHAPFDVIVVSAAFPAVPPALVEQLGLGGRLVQPIGPGGNERVNLYTKETGGLRLVRLVAYARFVPLVGRHGYREHA